MWHIGQDIVCIKSHSQAVIKEGDIFTIKGLKKGCCTIVIDVGISAQSHLTKCRCGNIRVKHDGIFWLGEQLFKPLDELTDISELLEHLENTATI
jgi:hypothetical protein